MNSKGGTIWCGQVVQITDALSKGVSHNLDLRIHA